MSKIGRKAIAAQQVKIQVEGNEVRYQGAKASGVYKLPSSLAAVFENNQVMITPADTSVWPVSAEVKQEWGLHRALLANEIAGAQSLFERQLKIVGLGFKAVSRPEAVEFALGFSHKVNFKLPAGVALVIDKTGQRLTLSSTDRELVGLVASQMRALRPPDVYKNTGIMYENEKLRRKAGKTK